MYQRKAKTFFVGSFLNHMDPCAYLLKWSRYAPALYFLKSLSTFKALTVIVKRSTHAKLCIISHESNVFFKFLLSLFSMIICVDVFFV